MRLLVLAALWLATSLAYGQPSDVEIRKAVEYVVHDGARLTGDYYAPRASGSYPAIVAIHGGGWQAGSPIGYQYWGPWLAQRGYVLFAISYRLSKPGQKTFPEALHDVRAAIQFVKGRANELRVNPERVGVMGDSAGGHLAALVALAGDHPQFAGAYKNDPHASQSTRVKVAIPIYGVFDMYQQWLHDINSRPRDDIVDAATQTEAFMLALKHAGHFVRPVPLEGAPHFWVSDPVDEPNSHNGFLAPRLLRFLQQRL